MIPANALQAAEQGGNLLNRQSMVRLLHRGHALSKRDLLTDLERGDVAALHGLRQSQQERGAAEVRAPDGSGLGLLHRSSQCDTFAGGRRGLQRQPDLGLYERVVVEAGAPSLIEGFLERIEAVAPKRRRKFRSRLGPPFAERFLGLASRALARHRWPRRPARRAPRRPG